MFEKLVTAVYGFLVVSEAPEVYRKLRETCRKQSLRISSKSKRLVRTYDPSKKNMCVRSFKKLLKVLKHGFKGFIYTPVAK